MKRSSSTKILTTHVGSLPRPDGTDRAGAEDDAAIREMVKAVVARAARHRHRRRQRGRVHQGRRLALLRRQPLRRLRGAAARGRHAADRCRARTARRSPTSTTMPSQRGTLFYEPGGQIKHARPHWVATAPITYRGADALKREIDDFRAVVGPRRRGVHHHHGAGEPRALPAQRATTRRRRSSCSRSPRRCASNTRPSSRPASSCRSTTPGWWRCGTASASQMGLEAFRKYCEVRVEALNHALRDIPEDRIRYHLCWGSWHGPHAFDIELEEHRRPDAQGARAGAT